LKHLSDGMHVKFITGKSPEKVPDAGKSSPQEPSSGYKKTAMPDPEGKVPGKPIDYDADGNPIGTLIKDNPVLNYPRTGSAKKVDGHHGFNDIIDNYAGDASVFKIPTKDYTGKVVRMSELRQIEGSLGKTDGVFEWIIDNEKVTHRRFIPGGKITGLPNQKSN
jgi:hypothetical protein